MKKSMFWKFIVTVILLSIMTTPAGAGKIDPDLKQRLKILKPAEKVSVLVLLNERLDTEAMKASLQASKATILLRDPDLRDEIRSMISRMTPIVQSIRKGENLDQPALSSEDEAAIYDLLDDLEPWASPRLRAAIKAVRYDIRMLRGMKIGQVRFLLR
jgi:hypothetical protein